MVAMPEESAAVFGSLTNYAFLHEQARMCALNIVQTLVLCRFDQAQDARITLSPQIFRDLVEEHNFLFPRLHLSPHSPSKSVISLS